MAKRKLMAALLVSGTGSYEHFKRERRALSQRVVDTINRWTERLPWIEGAYLNDEDRACWHNGAFLSTYGWAYLFSIMGDGKKNAVAMCIRYCKQYEIISGKDTNTEDFFSELWEATHNLPGGFYLDCHDNQEGVFCK